MPGLRAGCPGSRQPLAGRQRERGRGFPILTANPGKRKAVPGAHRCGFVASPRLTKAPCVSQPLTLPFLSVTFKDLWAAIRAFPPQLEASRGVMQEQTSGIHGSLVLRLLISSPGEQRSGAALRYRTEQTPAVSAAALPFPGLAAGRFHLGKSPQQRRLWQRVPHRGQPSPPNPAGPGDVTVQ